MTVPGSFKGLPADAQAQLDKLEPAIAQAFADAVAGVTDAAKIAAIEAEIARGNYQAAYDLLGITSDSFGQLRQAVTQAYWAGGNGAVIPTAPVGDPFISKAVLAFNGWHPRALAWTQTETGRLVTAIAADQRTGIQGFIRAGIEAGQSPRAVALDIVGRKNGATGQREGGIVGLTGQQMTWVANARAELGDPETAAKFLTRAARDKRFDRTIRAAIQTGKPLAQGDIDRIVTAYSSRLLKLRGEMIARTEALNALRAGRHEAWQQAIDQGRMAANDVIVEWSATMDKRTRHSHLDLDGSKVTFGGLFKSELGSLMEYPGDTGHDAKPGDIIQCRCMAIYRRRRRTDG